MGKWMERCAGGGIPVVLLGVALSSLYLSEEPEQPRPLWVNALKLTAADGEKAERIRSALTEGGVDEEQFWTLDREELSLIFEDTRDAEVVSHIIQQPSVQRHLNYSSACKGDPRDHPDFACIKGNMSEAFTPLLAVLLFVFFAVFVRAQRPELDKLRTVVLDGGRHEPQPNIQRAVAILTDYDIKAANGQPAWFILMGLATCWAQLFLPYHMFIQHRRAHPIHLEGLKTTEYFIQNWSTTFTAIASLVVVGVIIIRNVQKATLDEAVRCHRIAIHTSVEGGFGPKMNSSQKGRLRMGDVPRSPCWIYCWCALSMSSTIVSGFFLTLYMMSTIQASAHDFSAFVIGTMKVVFFLSVDELVVNALDFDDNVLKTYSAKLRTKVDVSESAIRAVSIKHADLMGAGMKIWFSLLDLMAFGGLVILLLTYWVGPDGTIQGI